MSAEVVYPVRRLGSNVTHFAAEAGLMVYRSTHWGAAFSGVRGPVVTLCRAVLADGGGRSIVWMQTDRATCRTCERFAPDAEVHQPTGPISALTTTGDTPNG